MCEEEEPSTGTNSIVLRNTSFGLADSMLDKGPPKLNLFRSYHQLISGV
jgi:hypothetical protein